MSSNPCNPVPVPATPADFRAVRPEFNDTSRYPDSEIQLWLDAASCMLPSCVWGNLLGLGTISFVAYNLAVYDQLMSPTGPSGATGQTPGTGGRGMITSEAAGAVSVSYDAALTAVEDGSIWNQNAYGQRFIWLARMVGHRPIQLNVPPWGGVCGGGCGCGAAFDPGGWKGSGRAGTLGPGWYSSEGDKSSDNVPVGKFIPPSKPGLLLP